MRLDLADFKCTEFELFSEFTVAPGKDAEIDALMRRTRVQDIVAAENKEQMALFVSESKIANITYRFVGTLTRKQDKDEMGYTLWIKGGIASCNSSPPPQEISPVGDLVDAGSDLFGSIAVHCETTFVYGKAQGYKSKIHFPMPLLVQEKADNITHIENAQFSHRNSEGDIEYQISLTDIDDLDRITHRVNFESTDELSCNSIRILLDRARSISTQLLIPPEDG